MIKMKFVKWWSSNNVFVDEFERLFSLKLRYLICSNVGDKFG